MTKPIGRVEPVTEAVEPVTEPLQAVAAPRGALTKPFGVVTKPMGRALNIGVSCRELHQEDRVLVNVESCLFGVFDGVSLNGGGAEAATIAVDAVDEWVVDHLRMPTTTDEAKELLTAALAHADGLIGALNKRRKTGGRPSATTAAVVLIAQQATSTPPVSVAVVATVGDSRVHLLRGGNLSTLSLDHSFAEEKDPTKAKARQDRLDDANSMDDLEDPIDRAAFAHRNVITHALQGSGDVQARLVAVQVDVGDRLVIDSDGVHDNLTNGEMTELLTSEPSAQQAATKVTSVAWTRSQRSVDEFPRAKPDDMSIVVIDVPAMRT